MQPMVVGFQLFTSTRRVCVYVGKMVKNRLRLGGNIRRSGKCPVINL